MSVENLHIDLDDLFVCHQVWPVNEQIDRLVAVGPSDEQVERLFIINVGIDEVKFNVSIIVDLSWSSVKRRLFKKVIFLI